MEAESPRRREGGFWPFWTKAWAVNRLKLGRWRQMARHIQLCAVMSMCAVMLSAAKHLRLLLLFVRPRTRGVPSPVTRDHGPFAHPV